MKKLPCWAKGSIVGFIISVVLLLILILYPMGCIGLTVDGKGCTPPTGFEAITLNLKLLSEAAGRIVLLAFFIIILSSFIGWIYGKIKNRNKIIN
jgi:hypothetical protein